MVIHALLSLLQTFENSHFPSKSALLPIFHCFCMFCIWSRGQLHHISKTKSLWSIWVSFSMFLDDFGTFMCSWSMDDPTKNIRKIMVYLILCICKYDPFWGSICIQLAVALHEKFSHIFLMCIRVLQTKLEYPSFNCIREKNYKNYFYVKKYPFCNDFLYRVQSLL